MSTVDDIIWIFHAVITFLAFSLAIVQIANNKNPVNVQTAHIWFFLCLVYLYVSGFGVQGKESIYMRWVNMDYNYYRSYHFLLIFVLFFTYLVAYMISRSAKRISFVDLGESLPDRRGIEIVSLAIVSIYIVTIIFQYSFDFGKILAEAMAARGERFQELLYLEEGKTNPLFSLLGVMQPAAVAILGESLARPGRSSALKWGLFALGLVFLFTQGSRTAFSIALLPGLITLLQRYSATKRIFMVTSAIALIVIVNGLILQFRAAGIGATNFSDLKLEYHQDNNLALTLYALRHADLFADRGDIVALLSVAFLNWIPRLIWPDKPSLSDLNLVNYKEDWWTQGYVGELVSMLGVGGGLLASIAFGIMAFIALMYLLSIKRLRLNVSWCMIVVLYIYMCLRSLLNITQYVYIFLPFVLGILFSHFFSKRSILMTDRTARGRGIPGK